MTNIIFSDAFHKSIGDGLSGSMAMVIQVSSLMWLRTTMNYQYRYGTTTTQALKLLYKEGGIRRFYNGYLLSLVIGPLSRFGDTMTNSYALNALENTNLSTNDKTLVGSSMAVSLRTFLMPIDTIKTTLQVEGKQGLQILKNNIQKTGPRVLFHGTFASMSATFVGHYPWFLTYNILNEKLPHYDDGFKNSLRYGFIGFNAAVISDCCSNSLRVIKTTKQTSTNSINYVDTIKLIVKEDGISGLFGRGLKTRIITNGAQGIIFTICWKFFEENYFSNK